MPSNNPSTPKAETDDEISPLVSRIQYERILIPHDGSEMSDRALRHAVYLSKISETEIVILHVTSQSVGMFLGEVPILLSM
jgi:nucleotide-binding universal stress UspA family protein